MKKLIILSFFLAIATLSKAQSSSYSYQVQYSLVDVDYTGGDTIFSAVCMLNLDTIPSNVSFVEINVGTASGLSDVRQLSIPYNQGTQVSLFNNNSKAMIQIGNLSPIRYYYQVRLKYQDQTYSSYIEQSSIAN